MCRVFCYMEKKMESDNSLKIFGDALLTFQGDISEQLSETFCNDLFSLLDEKIDNIAILLNTGGGDAFEGFGLFDLLKILPIKKTILCRSKVMSAGLLILAAGTQGQRLSLPHTTFMIHDISAGVPEEMMEASKIKNSMINIEKMNKSMLEILSKNSKLSLEEVTELSRKETYFDAKQALEFGFIDKIIGGKDEKKH